MRSSPLAIMALAALLLLPASTVCARPPLLADPQPAGAPVAPGAKGAAIAPDKAPQEVWDLELVSFTAPSSVVQGQDLTGLIEVVYRNAGLDTLWAGVGIEVFLAQDSTATDSDHRVTSCNNIDIPPGEDITVDFGACFQTPKVPLFSTPGPNWIRVRLDRGQNVAETDETNNDLALPITVVEVPKSTVYYEDFQFGESGWTPVDLKEQELHLQRVVYDDGVTSRGVWWCGEDDPSWASPPGYGNNWNQRLTKPFTLSAATPITLSWSMQYDVENGWDYVIVELSLDGGASFFELERYTDSTWGEFWSFNLDLSPYAGQTVIVSYRFLSDSSYSDEDGYYDSDGAYRLDSVTVTGHPTDTFETGGDGWTPSLMPGVEAAFRLEAEPACSPSLPCDLYADGTPVTSCNAWVAYDPVTGQFPEVSEAEHAAGLGIEIGIESPVIDIPADATNFMLLMDIFRDLPIENGIFYTWSVSSPAGAPWDDASYAYYRAEGWVRSTFDISDKVPDGATTMQVRLIALDYGWQFGYDPDYHTAAPFFDNVEIVAANTEAIGLDPDGYPRPCGATIEDLDGDGVIEGDPVEEGFDRCPGECAAWFDRDGDGCIDPVIGARHIEYWSADDLPLHYVINESGAPGITDDSDLAAIQAGFATWTAIPGIELAIQYDGPVAQADAQALDMVNLVTFADPDFVFPRDVLAVGLSTSFVTPEWSGEGYRPGQIVDCDMIFNPAFDFSTATQGSGTDIQSVVTHEAGHMLGLSHSAVTTSTMFYVLPPATSAAVLAPEDELAMLKAYPSDAALTGTSHLRGTVEDSVRGMPVGGVIVFAIDAADGDTLACEYTLPDDGSFHFIGLPDGDYYVAIHPLDGTSPIGYLEPDNINHLIASRATTAVVPEYWDDAESSTDDPTARTAVPVTAGGTTTVRLVTNVDTTGPVVVAVSPTPGATGVPIDAAVLVRFDEAIADTSLQGNFNLSTSPDGTLIPGNAALVEDDRTLAYVPTVNFDFATTYYIVVREDVRDIFGNALGADHTLSFTTQPRPAVSLDNLSPRKGPAGSVLVLTGQGFATDSADNTVRFGAEVLPVLQASATQIVVTVPAGAGPDEVPVTVTNETLPSPVPSDELTFTVLAPEEVARGQEIATVDLGALPRTVTVSPDGARVFVATDGGLSIVDVSDPTAPGHTPLAVAGGLNALAVAPGGQTLFAVSAAGGTLCRFQVDPPLLLDEIPVGGEPRGLLIGPAGRRAYVPTATGQIQVWDIREGSATFETRVGALAAPDANLTGRLAIEPTGARLLALSGAGSVLVFDLGPAELEEAVPVLERPRDLAVDAAGEILYVTDETGYVSLVSLQSLNVFLDIPTGGALRGLELSASGAFAYAADYQLDYLDVVDLRDGSSTYRQVALRIPQRGDPVDIAFAGDGRYVYSLAEAERMLVISAAGAGPVLSSLAPAAGPVGAKLVLAGSGLAGGRVLFGNAEAPVERGDDGALTVTVPPGAESGPVSVLGATDGEVSISLTFDILGATPDGGFRRQAATAPAGAPALSGALAVAPDGGLAALGAADGQVHLLDIDPASATYYGFRAQAAAAAAPVLDLAFAPDAALVYAVAAGTPGVAVVNADPASAGLGDVVRTIAAGAVAPGHVAVAPDGRTLALSDAGAAAVLLVDLATDIVTSVPLAGAVADLNGQAGEVAFHPAGAHAYVAIDDDDPATVLVLDVDPAGAGFGTVVGSVGLPAGTPSEVPLSLSFGPDGLTCLVLTSQMTGAPHRTVVTLDTSVPTSPTVAGTAPFATAALPMDELVRTSPAGDRAVLGLRDDGLLRRELPSLAALDGLDLPLDAEPYRFAYDPEGSRLLLAATWNDSVYAYDFAADQQLAAVWGEDQTGVVGQPLPSPLRVRVTDLETGAGAEGVPVTFRVVSGGGHLAVADPGATPTELVVGTDRYGYAQVVWVLGPLAGGQEVEVGAPGVAGSPIAYAATAVVDPSTQPLTLVESLLAPADGATDVGVTTAVQAVFSRPVDPASVVPTAFFLSADGGATAVPTVLGFSDGNRRASLTPVADLDYGATYTIVTRPNILDTDGGLLQNWRNFTFSTAAEPPPPTLTAVSPPSAAVTVGVILSGDGFSPVPGSNTVWFNELPATVTDGATDWVRAAVPIGATTGTVRVETGGRSTDTLPFTVLVPSTAPVDDVIATVGTGSSTRSITISPDGTILYAVSPEADLVVPVDLATLTTLPGIPVGDQPWALDCDPDGGYLYVANRLSGDVSIVDTRDGSPDWHRVIESLPVGTYPVDLMADPSGDRVLVANAGSQDLSVIDSDDMSSSFHRVIATVGTGSASRTVTISPDGGRIYVGTDLGYTVIDPVQYGVVRTVDTGTAAKSVAISPDGTLLVVVDTQGVVRIYDVADGSDRQDQVIATAPAGSSVKMASISPDGALLFLVLEEGDAILVYSLDLGRGVGALAPDATLPPFSLQLVATLSAGENPESIAFDPGGSGALYVSNGGDNTISVFGEQVLTEGKIAGRVYADCPEPGTGLLGVEIDVFENGSGALLRSAETDSLGRYEAVLPIGDYTVTMVTPLGYLTAVEEAPLTIAGGDSLTVDWPLRCAVVVPGQRMMSFWKHQVGVALRGRGQYDIDGPTLCGYLDLIESHFNSNLLNPVVVYTPPESDECVDKLQSAKELLNLDGDEDMLAHARQELMALLLNVAAGKLSLRTVISADGATVSRAITFVDQLIDDGAPANDETAMKVAKDVNKGKLVGAGVIPRGLPEISYVAPRRFFLAPCFPNPFNPETSIAFDVAAAGRVRLEVFDVRGRRVRTLVDEVRQPGAYTTIWNGRDNDGRATASGVYFYRLEAGDYVKTRKMMLVK